MDALISRSLDLSVEVADAVELLLSKGGGNLLWSEFDGCFFCLRAWLRLVETGALLYFVFLTPHPWGLGTLLTRDGREAGIESTCQDHIICCIFQR